MKSMQWPLEVWVRENLSVLSKRDFTGVVPWLAEEIDAYASSHSSTLQVENTCRVARNTAGTNPRQRFDPKALWDSTVFGTRFHSSYDRLVLPRTTAARVASQSKGTLSEEQFNGLSSTSPCGERTVP